MKKHLIGLLFAVAAGPAMSQTFVCSFSPGHQAEGWLPEQVQVTFKGGGVTLSDAMINQFNGGPIAGRVSRNNDSRFVVNWALNNVKIRYGSTSRANYSITYLKQRNRASIAMNAPDLEDIRRPFLQIGAHYSANGSCQQK